MEPGARVWCRDTKGDQAWILSEVVERTSEELRVFAVNDPDKGRFSRSRLNCEDGTLRYDGVELANAKLSDQDRAQGKDDDLITLPHLHEPAMLHAVEERFLHNLIYTWTGPVLISVNPFKRLPIYSRELLEEYHREGMLKSQHIQPEKKLRPHIYAVADRSYRQMMEEGLGKSQAILISGESGAGKTESTKIVMHYLTTMGNNSSYDSNAPQQEPTVDEKKNKEISVMERVMQSNPILEAFGNAKTSRNDNSSRFGKYIQLGFNERGVLMGARVQTYLLEKIRVGFHAKGERNYHIFYQVLRGCSPTQHARFRFQNDDATGGSGADLAIHYRTTGQGGAPCLRETDEKSFKATIEAMRSMKLSEDTIESVLDVIAGLLHLGQINFEAVAGQGDEVAEIANKEVADLTADLLGVDPEQLSKALTERKMVTRGDVLVIPLSPAKASEARDAIAKVVFGSMFLWVVKQVNNCCGWKETDGVRSTIGVLDIFGFESFEVNSFEQLCINFTNEALQQQFNRFIFKTEQAEYEAEQINWDYISFPDNQDVLDLISRKHSGILSMLDDECRVPRGSDRNWCSRMMKEYIPRGNETKDGRFSATNVQKSKNILCVTHFAGKVQYNAETGFLEKNKDEIPLTCKEMCETAPNQLLRDCYDVQRKELEVKTSSSSTATNRAPRRGPAKSKTVAQQFKEQLQKLIQQVEATEPHYIRCLKPNDRAEPMLFQRARTCEQLRCGGVLEAVRVARVGYPVRLSQEDFYVRYRALLPTVPVETLPLSLEDGADGRAACATLLDMLLSSAAATGDGATGDGGASRVGRIRRARAPPPPMNFPKKEVQLGLTKVFLRKPPHESLECHRSFHKSINATLLQAVLRGRHRYHAYQRAKKSTLTVQRYWRGCLARSRRKMLVRYGSAAVTVQRYWRGSQGRARRRAIVERKRLAAIAAERERERERLATITAERERERLATIAAERERERERLATIAAERERERERLAAIAAAKVENDVVPRTDNTDDRIIVVEEGDGYVAVSMSFSSPVHENHVTKVSNGNNGSDPVDRVERGQPFTRHGTSSERVPYGQPVANPIESSEPPKKQRRDRRRLRLLVVVLATVCCVSGIVGFFTLSRDDDQSPSMPSSVVDETETVAVVDGVGVGSLRIVSTSPSTVTEHPDSSAGPTEAPTRTPAYWRQVSPRLHAESYGHSVSLSADGSRLAVLHDDGFTVHDESGVEVWTATRNVSRAGLLAHLDLSTDVFADDRNLSLTALIELSLDGDRLLVHVDDHANVGRAVLYHGVDDGDVERWSAPLYTSRSPTSPSDPYYGRSAAYARGNGRRVVVGSVASELDEATGDWERVGGDLRESLSSVGLTTLMGDLANAAIGNDGNRTARDNARFGASVALSADGETAAVASPTSPVINFDAERPVAVDGDHVAAAAGQPLLGNVFAFEQASILGQLAPYWRQRGQVLSATRDSTHFGTIVMSRNGGRVAVGTPNDRNAVVGVGGIVHVFDFVGGLRREWRWVGKMREDESSSGGATNNTHFGRALAMSEDGSRLAVLAPRARNGKGRICVYHDGGSGGSSWDRIGDCLAPGRTNDASVQRFSMSFSKDGGRLAVGVPRNDYTTVNEDSDGDGDGDGDGSSDKAEDQGGYVTVYELMTGIDTL